MKPRRKINIMMGFALSVVIIENGQYTDKVFEFVDELTDSQAAKLDYFMKTLAENPEKIKEGSGEVFFLNEWDTWLSVKCAPKLKPRYMPVNNILAWLKNGVKVSDAVKAKRKAKADAKAKEVAKAAAKAKENVTAKAKPKAKAKVKTTKAKAKK